MTKSTPPQPSENAPPRHQYDMAFTVDFDFPVISTRGIFEPESNELQDVLHRASGIKTVNDRARCLVVVDQDVAQAQPDLNSKIKTWFAAHPEKTELVRDPVVVVGGESSKNDYRKTMEIIDIILEYKMCRQSYVIVIGGGAVLDAVGFATALVHRGLRLVRLPTTVLAQNDAGVGVKNAINLHGGKNTVGTFAPPWAVINDFDFLCSLSFKGWLGGVSEAFKVAIIKDREFFHRLCDIAPRIKQRDQDAMEELIVRCAELHLHHISTNGDPFEMGTARPLDFGHWAAHKLESMTNYAIGHGQAVAIGIAIDSTYACMNNWITEAERDLILKGLTDAGMALWTTELERTLGDGSLEVLGGLADFQEHLGGELCITFPDGLGKKFEAHEVDGAQVTEAVSFLKQRYAGKTA